MKKIVVQLYAGIDEACFSYLILRLQSVCTGIGMESNLGILEVAIYQEEQIAPINNVLSEFHLTGTLVEVEKVYA